ncbi:MAG TPA: hypothetical protein VMI55_07830 [Thermoplasmata archaeon]|nr:hypothetical protein [Thermoplasmata archaeon]
MALPGTDWPTLIQVILFALFAAFTALVTAVIGPTYDNLFVPMMRTSALYPPLVGSGGGGFLAGAVQFSTYTLVNVVDPLVALVALGVAVLFLVRSVVSRWADRLDGLLPRLVASVIVANFTIPIVGGVLALAGALYPVLAGWDGGAWTHWVNLAGYAQLQFSWDNGALAFVLSFVEFLIVFGLLLAIGIRDALLGVLIVLLPLFTLLWPLRPVAALARRAWLLFFEVTFLPCVVVVPLELAVGAASPVMLVGYLGVALAAPYLLSLAGTHLVAFGLPGSGGAVNAGSQRGFSAGSSTASSVVGPSARATASSGAAGRATAAAAGAAGTASFPAAAPLAAAELVGHTALHLLRHVQSGATEQHPWKPIRGPGAQ